MSWQRRLAGNCRMSSSIPRGVGQVWSACGKPLLNLKNWAGWRIQNDRAWSLCRQMDVHRLSKRFSEGHHSATFGPTLIRSLPDCACRKVLRTISSFKTFMIVTAQQLLSVTNRFLNLKNNWQASKEFSRLQKARPPWQFSKN